MEKRLVLCFSLLILSMNSFVLPMMPFDEMILEEGSRARGYECRWEDSGQESFEFQLRECLNLNYKSKLRDEEGWVATGQITTKSGRSLIYYVTKQKSCEYHFEELNDDEMKMIEIAADKGESFGSYDAEQKLFCIFIK